MCHVLRPCPALDPCDTAPWTWSRDSTRDVTLAMEATCDVTRDVTFCGRSDLHALLVLPLVALLDVRSGATAPLHLVIYNCACVRVSMRAAQLLQFAKDCRDSRWRVLRTLPLAPKTFDKVNSGSECCNKTNYLTAFLQSFLILSGLQQPAQQNHKACMGVIGVQPWRALTQIRQKERSNI